MRSPTRLPGAPEWVLGLVNLRGALITVVDLPARLGADVVEAEGVVLVAEGEGKTFGIRVDGVKDVVTLDAERLEAVEPGQSVDGVLSHVAYAGEVPLLICDFGALARHVLVIQQA